MAKKVTVINAVSGSRHTHPQQKLKVCAYARVSTGTKAQAESYATQVEYYTEKIESNPLWEFAGVYADEGITGTKVKGRDDFKTMIAACEERDIDLILTKSITRFARNTLECIQTIRKLKAAGVGIYFEKENINTLTEASELMLTILASVAQGESEDFSGNNRWAIISRFEKGTYIVGTPAYGYRKDEEGNLIIEESEAEVVRWIFESYLNGMGTYVIAKMLNDRRIPTIREGERWQDGVVKNILLNPVYEGDALRQRTYTEKQFPFTRKENKGQMNMYLTKDAHPPIITHVEDKEFCHMKAIREDVLQQAFTDMWNKLYTNQGTVLEPLLKALTELAERKPDSAEIEQLDNEIHSLSEQSRILNQVMKKGYMDSALFMEKNNQLAHRLTECRRKKTLLARKQKRTKEIVRTEQLIGLVKEEGYQTTFNEELFDLTVREIKISLDHEISFVLKNGLVLTERERGSGDAVAYTNRV